MPSFSGERAPVLLVALDGVSQARVRQGTRVAHVLIAEDDKDMRALLAARLRGVGYGVTECSNGIELLHELGGILDQPESTPVDLIVSDVRMPGLSGMDLLDGLADLDLRIPMVLITAFGSDELHAQAKRLGARAVFDKPFDMDALLAEVAKIV